MNTIFSVKSLTFNQFLELVWKKMYIHINERNRRLFYSAESKYKLSFSLFRIHKVSRPGQLTHTSTPHCRLKCLKISDDCWVKRKKKHSMSPVKTVKGHQHATTPPHHCTTAPPRHTHTLPYITVVPQYHHITTPLHYHTAPSPSGTHLHLLPFVFLPVSK